LFNPRHINFIMNKNTTFKQYLKANPFGNYELYTEAIRKILVAEKYAAIANEKTFTTPLKAFTIWMNRPMPTEPRSVFRIAVLAGVSSDKIRNDFEEIGIFASLDSYVNLQDIERLLKIDPVYLKVIKNFPKSL